MLSRTQHSTDQPIPWTPVASRYERAGDGRRRRNAVAVWWAPGAASACDPTCDTVHATGVPSRRPSPSRPSRRAPPTSFVRDRRRDVGQPSDRANDVVDVGLRRPTTNQRRQLPTCRSSLVATRSQRVFQHGEHDYQRAFSGCCDAGVITLATAPRGASPQTSRRRSRRIRCVETVRRGPITRWLLSLANLGSEDSRFLSILW